MYNSNNILEVEVSDVRDLSPLTKTYTELQTKYNSVMWSGNVFEDLWGKNTVLRSNERENIITEFFVLYTHYTKR